MKAARYRRTEQGYELLCEDGVLVPAPRDGEVRVRIAYCGICGSDLARYRQRTEPPPGLQQLFGDLSFIQGHEFSGVIDRVGTGVEEGWAGERPLLGTRVAVHPLIGCGECAACRGREWNRCERPEVSQVIGVHRDGGFSEWVTVPFDHVVPLGDKVPLDAAALTEPLAVALHAVNIAQITDLGRPVMIIGDGPIGLLIAHVLKRRGHKEVHLAGLHGERLELGRKFGAASVEDIREVSLHKDGTLRDVFQVAGSAMAVERGLRLLSGSGQMICLGYLHGASEGLGPIRFNDLIRGEKAIRGSFGSSRAEFESALRGMDAGEYDLSPLIDSRISLDHIVERGFERLLQQPRPAGKILVRAQQVPDAEGA